MNVLGQVVVPVANHHRGFAQTALSWALIALGVYVAVRLVRRSARRNMAAAVSMATASAGAVAGGGSAGASAGVVVNLGEGRDGATLDYERLGAIVAERLAGLLGAGLPLDHDEYRAGIGSADVLAIDGPRYVGSEDRNAGRPLSAADADRGPRRVGGVR